MSARAIEDSGCTGKVIPHIAYDPTHSFFGGSGGCSGVGIQHCIRNTEQRVSLLYWLGAVDIEQGCRTRALVKPCGEGRFVDDESSAGIDECGIGLEAGELIGGDKVAVGGSAIDMQGEDVGVGENCCKVGLRTASRGGDGQEIVIEDSHAQGSGDMADARTDAAKTDDTEGEGVEFVRRNGGDAERLPFAQRAGRSDGGQHRAVPAEHQRNDILGDRGGVGIGCVENGNVARPAGILVDVVETDSGAAYDAEARSAVEQWCIDGGVGTDDESFGSRDGVLEACIAGLDLNGLGPLGQPGDRFGGERLGDDDNGARHSGSVLVRCRLGVNLQAVSFGDQTAFAADAIAQFQQFWDIDGFDFASVHPHDNRAGGSPIDELVVRLLAVEEDGLNDIGIGEEFECAVHGCFRDIMMLLFEPCKQGVGIENTVLFDDGIEDLGSLGGVLGTLGFEFAAKDGAERLDDLDRGRGGVGGHG